MYFVGNMKLHNMRGMEKKNVFFRRLTFPHFLLKSLGDIFYHMKGPRSNRA